MSRRDLFLMASAAALGSLLTYLATSRLTTSPQAPGHEFSADGAERAAPLESLLWAGPVTADGRQPEPAGAVQPASSPANPATRHDGNEAKDPALVIQRRQELGERFAGLLANGGKPDSRAIGTRVENRFYSEEWNQEWAGTRERNIRTLFDSSEDLSGLTPLQVTCRSRNCQVVLTASTQEQVRLASEKFMQAATRSDVGMKDKVVSFFPDITTGRVIFYLSENGNTELFH